MSATLYGTAPFRPALAPRADSYQKRLFTAQRVQELQMNAPQAASGVFRAGVGIGLVLAAWVRTVIKNEKAQEKTMESMKWADPAEAVTTEEGCIIVGEEVGENGKTWFACKEPLDDSAAECEINESLHSDAWLCKVEKPKNEGA
eukprot:4801557-Pleurochrysis_carterae.AAC.6